MVLGKVQQAHVSYNVIDDLNDCIIQSESNGELENGTELLIYTPVRDKKYHSPFRLFGVFYGVYRFIELLSRTVYSVICH